MSKSSSSKGKGKALFAQMGMFNNMADMEQEIYGGDDDDDDLEAELLALQAEDSPSPPKRSPVKSQSNQSLKVSDSGMKKIPSGLLELDNMIQDSMKDIDEDVSDTEDPELEAELLGLENDDEEEAVDDKSSSGVDKSSSSSNVLTVIESRLNMYETAYANAVSGGDVSKSKRLDRGIKTLKDQLRKVKCGKPVSEQDIPPEVAVSANKREPSTAPQAVKIDKPTPDDKAITAPVRTSPVKPMPTTHVKDSVPYSPPKHLNAEDAENHRLLTVRKDQYKTAALEAKQSDNAALASRYFKTYKQFDNVIKAVENNQPYDLKLMPPPPPGFKVPETMMKNPKAEDTLLQKVNKTIPDTKEDSSKKDTSASGPPGSTLEALEQRLKKYKETEKSAKDEGNGSKARRMGRIVKQYEDAIKMTKSGKAYAYEELPTPPGFEPIPLPSSQSACSQTNAGPSAAEKKPEKTPSSQPAAVPSKPKPGQSSGTPVSKGKPLQRQMSAMSRCEQQTLFLQERQLQFKKAALKAKTSGDLELAKKYLRQAKGFDQMIEALQAGLPVNLSNIPKPPDSEDTLEFVKEDGSANSGDRNETYKKLEQELIQQIKTAETNGEHFTKLGDVSTAAKFDKLNQSAKKDLAALKNAYKHGDPVPRFHYENKTFSIVQSCTDLGDNDLEICVIRGINYNLPSGFKEGDLDTYIKYEFPFPKDTPQKGDSSTCKGTNCPEYDQAFKVSIERKSRVFSRIVNSKSIKIDVYYKRGLFKGDKLLGTANVKLQSLENMCIFHETHDLMDGRKAAGGKLEVKLRIRNPFVGKQVDEVKEKWLIIDKFERAIQSTPQTTAKSMSSNSSATKDSAPSGVTSMEVLKYEKQLLEQQIKKYQGKLKPAELTAIQHKVVLLDKQVAQQKEQIRKGGINGLKVYADSIEKSQNQYLEEAKVLVKQGNREKAQIFMTKKKLVEKEVESIRQKLPG